MEELLPEFILYVAELVEHILGRDRHKSTEATTEFIKVLGDAVDSYETLSTNYLNTERTIQARSASR